MNLLRKNKQLHFLRGKRGRNINILKSDSLTFNSSELCKIKNKKYRKCNPHVVLFFTYFHLNKVIFNLH